MEHIEFPSFEDKHDEVDLRHESEIFQDHERIDNGKDIDDQLAQLRDALSEDSDGIIRLPIPAYEYDTAINPFVGMGPQVVKTYEISRYIDVVFLHRFMYQDIIVCGLQSGKFVPLEKRGTFVKHIRDTGGIPLDTDEPRPFDIVGLTFVPFVQYHTTDPVFRLYHTLMPRVEERPHYPLDVWMIFDAHAYEEVPYATDFRRTYKLKPNVDRRASLLGVAQIN